MSHIYHGFEDFVLNDISGLAVPTKALCKFKCLTDYAEVLEYEPQQPISDGEVVKEMIPAATRPRYATLQFVFYSWVLMKSLFCQLIWIWDPWDFKHDPQMKKRLRCATMPWAIPPALVILWGVCWMFWPPLPYSVPGEFTHDPQLPDPSGNAINVTSEFDDIDSEYHGHENMESDLPRVVNQIKTGATDFSPYDLSPRNFDNWENTDWIGTASDSILSSEVTLNTMPADDPFGAPLGGYSIMETSATMSSSMPQNLELNKGSSHTLSKSNTIGETTESSVRATASLTSTMDVSSTEKKFTCLDCGEGFTRASTLQRHQSEKHSDDPEIFPCPSTGCKRSDKQNAFKRAAHLTRHLKSCKKRPERQKSSQEDSSEHHSAYHIDDSHSSAVFDESKETGRKRKAADEENLNANTSEQVIDFLKKRRRQLLAEADAGERKVRAQREEARKLGECIKSLEGGYEDGAGM
ncbi:unnamed protein product [Clonostachys rosea]|uniref:C2H2-type domain-containing protein n=1 Tax=Bionectria ochroleuca TaxID=29856 RepID=A0ABY6U9L1_BIOOC|nr:unnamed protein product [Clonostachys rosea]